MSDDELPAPFDGRLVFQDDETTAAEDVSDLTL